MLFAALPCWRRGPSPAGTAWKDLKSGVFPSLLPPASRRRGDAAPAACSFQPASERRGVAALAVAVFAALFGWAVRVRVAVLTSCGRGPSPMGRHGRIGNRPFLLCACRLLRDAARRCFARRSKMRQELRCFKIFLPARKGRASARQSASQCAAACGGVSVMRSGSCVVMMSGSCLSARSFMAAQVLVAALPCLRRGPSRRDGTARKVFESGFSLLRLPPAARRGRRRCACRCSFRRSFRVGGAGACCRADVLRTGAVPLGRRGRILNRAFPRCFAACFASVGRRCVCRGRGAVLGTKNHSILKKCGG